MDVGVVVDRSGMIFRSGMGTVMNAGTGFRLSEFARRCARVEVETGFAVSGIGDVLPWSEEVEGNDSGGVDKGRGISVRALTRGDRVDADRLILTAASGEEDGVLMKAGIVLLGRGEEDELPVGGT